MGIEPTIQIMESNQHGEVCFQYVSWIKGITRFKTHTQVFIFYFNFWIIHMPFHIFLLDSMNEDEIFELWHKENNMFISTKVKESKI